MLKPKQKAVLVLGMHRSGTSALTRVLHLLGLDLPTRLMPATHENRQGYWESLDLEELHDQALASCDSWWADWRRIPQEWFASAECRLFGDRLMSIVTRDFANSDMFIVKDPRMCRLAPLWFQTLAQLQIEPLVIITVRHPSEVAASLAVRNGFDPLMSKLLWLRHVLDAERYRRGLRCSIVTFDALMSNWRSTVNKVREDLQIEWPVPPASAAAAIEEFLSPSDQHHSAPSNSALPPWVASAYDGLLSEAEKDRKRWNPERWNRFHREVDRADAIFGGFLGLDEAEALRAELQKTVGEAAALRAELQKTVGEAAELRAELQKTVGEVAELRAELHSTWTTQARLITALRAELQKTGSEVAELRAERQKTAGELAELRVERQKAAGEVAELRAEQQKTAGEGAALRTELQKTAGEAAALRAERKKTNEEVELVKQTAVRRASSIAELTENIRTLQAAAGREIEALKTDREQAKNEVSALLNSTSWRITAPLRAIKRFLRVSGG